MIHSLARPSVAASPVQFAAVKAYEYSQNLKQYVADSSAILSGVSSFIFENLTQYKISATNPQGAFYMMIGFDQFKRQINSKGIYTSKELPYYQGPILDFKIQNSFSDWRLLILMEKK